MEAADVCITEDDTICCFETKGREYKTEVKKTIKDISNDIKTIDKEMVSIYNVIENIANAKK